jgi:hypothetical protein
MLTKPRTNTPARVRSAPPAAGARAVRRVQGRAGGPGDSGREIHCSDLYNLTQSIADQQQAAQPQPQPQQAAAPQPQPQQGQGQQQRPQPGGASYYAGLVTTDLRQDNGASGSDMLKRSLQFAGGAGGRRGGRRAAPDRPWPRLRTASRRPLLPPTALLGVWHAASSQHPPTPAPCIMPQVAAPACWVCFWRCSWPQTACCEDGARSAPDARPP